MSDITLCFDFGNSRLKYGVFREDNLITTDALSDNRIESFEKLLDKYKPKRTLLSSVIDHDKQIEELLRLHSDLLILRPGVLLPFSTPVARPETIGADRLAISAYASTYFPNQNNLVIALGSCITYNFINKYHCFLGGGISPGMEMRFKSMHQHTALLPLVKPDWNFPLIGYDTRTNILSGVMLGMAEEMNGMIRRYEEKFLNFNVLLTGGDSADFAPHIKYKIFADPALIVKGLYAISKYNYENKN